MKPNQLPQPNRLIKCTGQDIAQFSCVGMFVPYAINSPQSGSGRGSRFCIRTLDGKFMSDRETWKQIETWEYLDYIPLKPSGSCI